MGNSRGITGKSVLWVGLLAALALASAGGCQADQSAARIAMYEQLATSAAMRATAAESQIAMLQAQLTQARAAFDAPGLAPEQKQQAQAIIDKLAADLGKAEEARKIAQAVIAETQPLIEQAKANPNAGAELDILTQLVQSVTSRLGPQTAAWGTVVTIILSIIATALKSRQAKGLKTQLGDTQTDLEMHRATLGAIVEGVEKAPETEGLLVKASIKEVMKGQKILHSADALVDDLKSEIRAAA